jgi:hypothetical protein
MGFKSSGNHNGNDSQRIQGNPIRIAAAQVTRRLRFPCIPSAFSSSALQSQRLLGPIIS